ncbi:hypothetical protein [uncultured Jatrophihabitans sp.]|uniref:hypothetical protein n=1 Tax=uncultured Jatrophihabitans sp. TaxID=1610747 RepID=UPI0035CC5F56
MSAGAAIGLVLACLIPTGIGCACVLGRRVVARFEARRPHAPPRPLESIAHDVRRLHDLLDRTENADDLPAKNQRCVATRAAYLDALTAACGRLDVLPPAGRPVSRAEIYRVEADLRRVGLDVRPS